MGSIDSYRAKHVLMESCEAGGAEHSLGRAELLAMTRPLGWSVNTGDR